MVFSATFNNISAILWRSHLLVEEPEDPEKTPDLSQVTDKLYHIMLYTSLCSRFELTTSVVYLQCNTSSPNVEQKVPTLPEHLSSLSVFHRLVLLNLYGSEDHWLYFSPFRPLYCLSFELQKYKPLRVPYRYVWIIKFQLHVVPVNNNIQLQTFVEVNMSFY
jgi:hypothetical protein